MRDSIAKNAKNWDVFLVSKKVVYKLKLAKNAFYKKGAPKYVDILQ